MSLFKRVLEVNGKFIPQVLKFPFGWCSRCTDGYLWVITGNQFRYCSYNTLEEAKKSIEKTHKV